MITLTTHTTKLELNGETHEVELQLEVVPAERDVGIMQDYIDNWSVTSIDGSTSAEDCLAAEQAILDEYDDDDFVGKLYDEGALND